MPLACSKMALRLISRTWELPVGVPSDVNRFLSEGFVVQLKWLLKYTKRRLFCFVFVEFLGVNPERKVIGAKHKRILWINWAAPSLGDSLMDLSARVLLADRSVTLLTHPKNANLYRNDQWLVEVFSDPNQLVLKAGRSSFDLVICDSFSPRVLMKKLYVAPFAEFCGLYGYVNGFEVHRTLFSFYKMRDLLSTQLTVGSIRPCISIGSDTQGSCDYDICLAIGGEWAYRTYNYWHEVVPRLEAMGFSIVLVGSENGRLPARTIVERSSSVVSTVGRLSLNEVANLISKCRLFVGADGGLWHIASSIPIPTVVLFADCQIFNSDGIRVTRETAGMDCITCYDEECVSNISPTEIAGKIESFFRVRANLN